MNLPEVVQSERLPADAVKKEEKEAQVMKRILRVGILGTTISVLFTGCGSTSLVSGVGGGYEEIAWEIMETEENRDQWGQAGLPEGETAAPIEIPDYYEQTQKEREENLENLEGTAAFKMKDGHSQDTRDLEYFKVGELLDDGTFVYYYSTRVGSRPDNFDENRDSRSLVHCVAKYNYKTQVFSVLHENTFTRTTVDKDEDKEAFYVQMCKNDGTGDIFVYDNGSGYLYNSAGAIEFQTNIEDFVRKHFGGYSVVATEAFTDDENRIYVDLAIEKELISIPDEDEDDDISEEDADKEAEELDKEVDDKTIEVVLVYDFDTYTSSLDQAKTNFSSQVSYWQTMRNIDAGYLNWAPPAEEDWNTAVQNVPSQWGTTYLYSLRDWSDEERKEYGITDAYHVNGTPVFQWTGEKKFGYREDGYVSDFMPEEGYYKPFTDLKANTVLSNVFTFIDGHYYELYGMVGNDMKDGDYNPESFERNVLRINEVKKEDGTTEQVSEWQTQSLSKNTKRDTYPSNCYLEGYWIQEDISTVLNIIDGEVFCLKGDKLCWLKEDGTYHEMISGVGEESIVDIFKEDSNYYVTYAIDDYTLIYEYDSSKIFKGVQLISKAHTSDVLKEVAYLKTSVDSKYHSAYENMTEKSDGKRIDKDAGELLDSENLLHVTVSNPQTELLKKIEENPNIEIPQNGTLQYFNTTNIPVALSQTTGDGYLITSMINGLVYLDIVSGKAICLEDGTWYGVWEQGDTYVAVGFPDDNMTYESMDMVHARVMEFKMDDLYKSRLEKILQSVSPEEVKPKKEDTEGAKQMKDDYNQNYKDENVDFVEPDYEAWKNHVPGSIVNQ